MSERRVITSGGGVLVIADEQLGIAWVLPDPNATDDALLASAFATRNRATVEGSCPECGAAEKVVGGRS